MAETKKARAFPDGYNMETEYEALKDILDADDPSTFTLDPRWPRVQEYWDRAEELERESASYQVRRGADELINNAETDQGRLIGGLVDDEQDQMTIHTREAFQVFTGRARDPKGQIPAIVGGRRAAASLRALWYLSGNDNPYADWALVVTDEMAHDVRNKIRTATARFEGMLAKLAQRGLSYSVLRSRQPAAVELGFKSPYGYTVASLIVEYDFCSRLIKTLVRKDQLSDDEGQNELRQLRRQVRSLFEQPCRYERYLMRSEMKDLSRRDFLPIADEEGKKRVQAAHALFGEVPRDIFVGENKPRHSKRHLTLSPQELKLLEQVVFSNDESVAVTNSDSLGQGLL